MNALKKSSEVWHTSVNLKARPVVEGEHDKSWNDHDPMQTNKLRTKLLSDTPILVVEKILDFNVNNSFYK